jgi:hypothetical protein
MAQPFRLPPVAAAAPAFHAWYSGSVKNEMALLADVPLTALTMGVMNSRRNPGSASSVGQKWCRKLITRPAAEGEAREERGMEAGRRTGHFN